MGFFNVDGRKRRKRTRGDKVSRPTDTGKEGRKRHKVWSWTAGLIKIHFQGDSWTASKKILTKLSVSGKTQTAAEH